MRTLLSFLIVVIASTTHNTAAFIQLISYDGKTRACGFSMRCLPLSSRAKTLCSLCVQRYPSRRNLGIIKQELTCRATKISSSSNISGAELTQGFISSSKVQSVTQKEAGLIEAEQSIGDVDSRDPEVTPSNPPPTIQQYNGGESRSLLRKPTARLQRLKDLLTKKEALEALAVGELSLKLDLSGISGNGEQQGMSGGAHLATIDYNRIARRLYDSLRAVRGMSEGASTILPTSEIETLNQRLVDMQAQVCHGAGALTPHRLHRTQSIS
jgi:hypothetical protein